MKKICGKCKKEKSIKLFHPAGKGKLKLQSYCMDCAKEQTKRWQAKNRKFVREYSHSYYRTNRGRFFAAKKASKNRKISWELSLEQFCQFLQIKTCHYCEGMFPMTETSSGLDRMDNNIGYTLANCVRCCGTCNKIKNNILSYEEMKVMIKALIQYKKGAVSSSF